MHLEPIIKREVSQKNKYHILTHIYGIQKNGTEEFIYRATMENRYGKQTYGHGERGGEGEMYGKSNMKLTLPYVKQPTGICCMAQETQTGSLYQPREWDGEGDSKGRGYMYTYG